jgi:hypothetical protein
MTLTQALAAAPLAAGFVLALAALCRIVWWSR